MSNVLFMNDKMELLEKKYNTESSVLEIKELTALAKEILNKRTAFQTNLRNNNKAIFDILRVGTSAGGAKPKAIIAYNETTGEVRSGQVQTPEGFSYWLLKFDGMEGGKIKDNPLGIGKMVARPCLRLMLYLFAVRKMDKQTSNFA